MTGSNTKVCSLIEGLPTEISEVLSRDRLKEIEYKNKNTEPLGTYKELVFKNVLTHSLPAI